VRSARGPHTLHAAQTQAEKKEPLGFGYWAIEVVREAQYRITMQFEPVTVLDACNGPTFMKQARLRKRLGSMVLTLQFVRQATFYRNGWRPIFRWRLRLPAAPAWKFR
jgi:hypothetical protein